MDAVRQRRIGGIDGGAGPAHGRGRIDRSLEIIAERGAERGLVTLVDADVIERRRPEVLGVDVQELRQGLGFGVEALAAALRLGERTTSDVERLAGGGMSGLGAQRCGFRFGDRGLRRLGRLGERRHVGASLCL